MMNARVAPPGAADTLYMSEAESNPPPDAEAPVEGAEAASAGEKRRARKVQKVSLGKYLVLLPLYVVARLWLATLRMRLSEQELSLIHI